MSMHDLSYPCEDHGERIATLESQMQSLVGNGQPGRVRELENVVKNHQRLIWMGMGIVVALQVLLVLLHFVAPLIPSIQQKIQP